MQGRVIGAAGPLHPCIPCIELYYQRYSHHFHSSEGLTSSFLPSDPLLGGVKENFYRGRHRLKTYVRVQESSRNVMRVRVWAETLVIQGVLFGVTTVAGMLQAWRYTYRTAWCSMEDEMESSTESASASRLRA